MSNTTLTADIIAKEAVMILENNLVMGNLVYRGYEPEFDKTINGYKVSETERTRGPLKAGYFADMIAVPGNPLDDLEVLKKVQFVMKDGQVFKRDGVMTPAPFFHAGPVNGWRIR